MTGAGPEPIFILSLPRSGSTLLQHLLAAHPAISTAAEPWVLLPFVYALRRAGVSAEYGHDTMAQALHEFVEQAGGRDRYHRLVRNLVSELYAAVASQSARFFLDKTPHYALAASEVLQIFPDAKVVFLWRNPLAVAASILKTFPSRSWPLYPYAPDFFQGLDRLVRAYATHKERAVSVRYEDLVTDPDAVLERICSYLGLEYSPGLVRNFSKVQVQGSMKDPMWGRYTAVSTEPLDRWKAIMRGRVRGSWSLAYVRWLGRERLRLMGYDFDTLLEEARTLRGGPLRLRDMRALVAAGVKARVRARLLRTCFHVWPPRHKECL